jgi:hypothetical protein
MQNIIILFSWKGGKIKNYNRQQPLGTKIRNIDGEQTTYSAQTCEFL